MIWSWCEKESWRLMMFMSYRNRMLYKMSLMNCFCIMLMIIAWKSENNKNKQCCLCIRWERINVKINNFSSYKNKKRKRMRNLWIFCMIIRTLNKILMRFFSNIIIWSSYNRIHFIWWVERCWIIKHIVQLLNIINY